MGPLYLQEKTQTIGQRPNRPAMAAELVQFAHSLETEDTGFRNIGVWEFCGLTGPWPQVLGLYEFRDGWETVATIVSETMRDPGPSMSAIYSKVEQMRYGGVDEILKPADGCPTLDQLLDDGELGTLLVREDAQVRTGAESDYSAAVLEEWAQVREASTYSLMGLYEGALTEGLVVAYWLTTLDGYRKLAASGQLDAWRKRGRELRSSWRTEIWTAAPASRFAPPAASLGESGNFSGSL